MSQKRISVRNSMAVVLFAVTGLGMVVGSLLPGRSVARIVAAADRFEWGGYEFLMPIETDRRYRDGGEEGFEMLLLESHRAQDVRAMREGIVTAIEPRAIEFSNGFMVYSGLVLTESLAVGQRIKQGEIIGTTVSGADPGLFELRVWLMLKGQYIAPPFEPRFPSEAVRFTVKVCATCHTATVGTPLECGNLASGMPATLEDIFQHGRLAGHSPEGLNQYLSDEQLRKVAQRIYDNRVLLERQRCAAQP